MRSLDSSRKEASKLFEEAAAHLKEVNEEKVQVEETLVVCRKYLQIVIEEWKLAKNAKIVLDIVTARKE